MNPTLPAGENLTVGRSLTGWISREARDGHSMHFGASTHSAPVIDREKRMLLRHYLEEGLSESAIARKLKIRRDTIHRLIRTGQLDQDLDVEPVRYKPRPEVPTKLTLYKPVILMQLEAYPPALAALGLGHAWANFRGEPAS